MQVGLVEARLLCPLGLGAEVEQGGLAGHPGPRRWVFAEPLCQVTRIPESGRSSPPRNQALDAAGEAGRDSLLKAVRPHHERVGCAGPQELECLVLGLQLPQPL